MPTGNNYSSLIRFNTKPEVRLPEARIVSKNGKQLADTTNGISGITPYNIETDTEVVVFREFETCVVECGEDISKFWELTTDVNGRAVRYIGTGTVIGVALGSALEGENVRVYTYPVWVGTGGGGGTNDHQSLINRDVLNTHPSSSISFTNPDPTAITVGGLTSGTSLVDKNVYEIFDLMLYPELFGTLTAPSSTFTSNVTGFREIGELIGTITFNSSFNRGSINPQYLSDSPFRSGLPNTYVYTGSGLANFPSTILTDAKSITNYTVVSGGQSWTGRVAYDVGVQPKGSKGTPFNTPLTAGQTAVITRTITGVYPFFANTVNITTMTKQTLQASGSQIIVDVVAESGSDKQSMEVATAWGSLSAIHQWNTISSTWDLLNIATFTTTDIQKTVQGNLINYKKHTHNGSLIGARRLRFTF